MSDSFNGIKSLVRYWVNISFKKETVCRCPLVYTRELVMKYASGVSLGMPVCHSSGRSGFFHKPICGLCAFLRVIFVPRCPSQI